jgi:hypothetical protein
MSNNAIVKSKYLDIIILKFMDNSFKTLFENGLTIYFSDVYWV